MIKMMKMIFLMCKRIFFIFQDYIIFYENFMTLSYQENHLLRYKMNFLFISNIYSINLS